MGRGGAELRTVEILRHIDRRKYRFHFCAVSGLPGEFDEEIRSLGGEVHLIHRGRASFPRRFAELLRRERFDVVHSHLQYISGYILRLAAQHEVPIRVAHFRSSRSDRVPGLKRRIYVKLMSLWDDRYANERVMRRWIDRYATNIAGVSEWSLTSAWRADWQSDPRCRVVYDGVEPSAFDVPRDAEGVRREFGISSDGPLYIHAGRMAEPKNHVRLVDIFAEVLRRQPAANLLLIGRTTTGRNGHSVERRVRRRIAKLGIEHRVVIAGERKDVPRLLKAADVFLFPSIYEGLGDAVLEASAAGTPALCTDLPCIREIADRLPGVRCLSLEEPDSTWARQAEAMSRTAPSRQQRAAALAAFRKSVFHIRHCTDALCRIWQGASPAAAEGETVDG